MEDYISNKVEMILFFSQYLQLTTLSVYSTEAIFGRIQYYSFRIDFNCRGNKEPYGNCRFLIQQLCLLPLSSMQLKFLSTAQLFFIPLKINLQIWI